MARAAASCPTTSPRPPGGRRPRASTRTLAVVASVALTLTACADRTQRPTAAFSPPSAATTIAHPDATSTGVPAGVALRPSGSVTVTRAGTVVDGLEVTGQIVVDAPDVTIRRSAVYATGSLGIHVRSGSAIIEDVDVIGRDGCAVGIGYANYTARRVDISGCQDGAKIGDDTTLVDSYIHDLLKREGSHNDGIQCTGGCTHVRILRNTIRGPHRASTASVKFSTNNGPISDVVIQGNLLAGGSYTIYFDDKGKGYGPATDFHVIDNVIEADSFKWGWRTGDLHPTQTWRGNRVG